MATYGEVARVSGFPNQARLVGYALNKLPKNTKLPWHRVVNSQGKISFPKNGNAYRLQKTLLKKEGVLFQKEKIDLKIYSFLNNFK